MTRFENFYTLFRYSTTALNRIVYEDLKKICLDNFETKPQILDVGGRKSHYTIGVGGIVTISDLLRSSEVQKSLNLGINNDIIELTKSRRSNIAAIVYDDMTKSDLADNSFDVAVAIEVLEHVERDADFIKEVYRVLKPGGIFYMTTPNGDARPIPNNPDHIRHYKLKDLQSMLSAVFDVADVRYAVTLSKNRTLGLRSYSLKKPFKTMRTIYGNIISYNESIKPGLENMAKTTAHLIAVCHKRK